MRSQVWAIQHVPPGPGSDWFEIQIPKLTNYGTVTSGMKIFKNHSKTLQGQPTHDFFLPKTCYDLLQE